MDSLNTRPPANREEFWARFFWGALFGGAVGVALLLEAGWPGRFAFLAVPAGSVLLGVTAGWFGDRFWYTLLRLLGR